jgi:hypothetical protein
MSLKHLTALLLALGGASVAVALAQTADSVNPAVNTSPSQADAPAAAAAPAPTASAQATAVASAHDAPAAAPARGSGGPVAGSTASSASTASPPGTASAPRTAAPGPVAAGSSDRIELGTTEISGNRELPKLMYIVPWQRAEVGRITGRPPNSLVDEALTPVDRTVFERQNNYFAALQAASASAPSQPAAPGTPPAPAGPRDEK